MEAGVAMGFAVWVDRENSLVWAQGTHEYRPMGTAVIAVSDQFRHRDFQRTRKRPRQEEPCFAGFYGSLEEVNAGLRAGFRGCLRWTPGHLR